MDEKEWLESKEPDRMLRAIDVVYEPGIVSEPGFRPEPRLSRRKARLFACACHRLIRGGPLEHLSDGAILSAERHADDPSVPMTDRRYVSTVEDAYYAAEQASRPYSPDAVSKKPMMADVLRCIAGNPFQRISLPPGPPCGKCGGEGTIYHERDTSSDRPCHDCDGKGSERSPWLTDTVLSLAKAAYDERSPGRKCGKCRGTGKEMSPVFSVESHISSTSLGVSGYRPIANSNCPACHGNPNLPPDGSLDPFRLGLLADALEEAGCAGEPCGKCKGEGKAHWEPKNDREDREFRYMTHAGYRREDWMAKCEACDGKGRLPHPLLEHLRSPGPHWRGCHALDILLGKD